MRSCLRLLLLCLVALLPTASAALSCLRPDVARTYLAVDATQDRWGAVVGRLHFDKSRLPEDARDPAAPPVIEIRGQLIGQSLGPQGFAKPFQDNVRLLVECAGPWCGGPESGGRYLAFIRIAEDRRPEVIADPCGRYLFPNPSRADLERLERCFLGGFCAPEPDG